MWSSAPTSRHSGPSNRAAWAAQANTRPAGPTTSTPTTRWRRYSSRTAVGWSFPTCAAATAAAEGRAGWWYLFYFATERGRLGYRRHTDDLTKLIWQLASPTWDFDGATFDCTAASFANPDHVDIVIHNYRWRLGLAEGEERYLGFEQRLAERPTIAVPTITIGSDFDGANADGKAYPDRFTGSSWGTCGLPREHRPSDSSES
jgi:hypothetical protein